MSCQRQTLPLHCTDHQTIMHQTTAAYISLPGHFSSQQQPTLFLEVGVTVGPSPSSAQIGGGRWGEVLSLVQTPLFIGCKVAGRAQHSAGCNARQLGTQEVGLCTWEGWVGRHLQD